jgi:hypothetical protein
MALPMVNKREFSAWHYPSGRQNNTNIQEPAGISGDGFLNLLCNVYINTIEQKQIAKLASKLTGDKLQMEIMRNPGIWKTISYSGHRPSIQCSYTMLQ